MKRRGPVSKPRPKIDLPTGDWRDGAACRTVDPKEVLFFPPDEDGRKWSPTAALSVCARCPVWIKCRAEGDATEPNETLTHGVRGGETREARIARRRKTKRMARI